MFRDEFNTIIDLHSSPLVTRDQNLTFVGLDALEAPARTAWIEVRGIVAMNTPPTTFTDFHAFDDFSLTVIPEPSIWLLTVCGLMGATRHRRR